MVPYRRQLPCSVFGLVLLALALGGTPARAILFMNSGDTGHNTTAPTGQYAGSGWQWQGYFGNFLATVISPHHIITAQHIGTGNGTFVHDGLFTGGTTSVYNINTAVNGGLGYWDIPDSDLRIYEVDGTFSSWAPLADSSAAESGTFVMFGRGGVRGTGIYSGAELRGWEPGPADGVARWGTNTLENGFVTDGQGREFLWANFDGSSGAEEGFLSVGDSGGAMFVQDNGVWKLAGIHYGVDGYFDTNTTTGDGSEFDAALFDASGLYIGSDTGGWTLIPDDDPPSTSGMYASRISSSIGIISGIITVPEPSSSACLMAAATVLLRRRRH